MPRCLDVPDWLLFINQRDILGQVSKNPRVRIGYEVTEMYFSPPGGGKARCGFYQGTSYHCGLRDWVASECKGEICTFLIVTESETDTLNPVCGKSACERDSDNHEVGFRLK
jgi:hypothetical protein